MRRVLIVGDAACESGFAKSTHRIANALKGWQIFILGLNYRGDPHPYPYQIFPAWVPGGDLFGVSRLLPVMDMVHPDLVVIQNDPWNIPAYMYRLNQLKTPPPCVGIIAVDGKHCMGAALNKLSHAIFWTEFAQQEAIAGGMTIPSSVTPLGVDLDVFVPGDAKEARRSMGFPQDVVDGFIVGNINRNQPRKRLDLTIRYFGEWIKSHDVRDAFLYLHVAPTGDLGYNCEALAKYYGFNNTKENNRLILAEPEMFLGTSESIVVKTLQTFDLQISTTLGEGMGLTTLEGMACQIGQIIPGWSALLEWASPGAFVVQCTSTEANPASVIGGVMDEAKAIEALDLLYRRPDMRASLAAKGRALATSDKFNWDRITAEVAAVLERFSPA